MSVVRRKPIITTKLEKSLDGPITINQLRGIITKEAALINLSFDDAVENARNRTLPRNHIGDDIALLVELLPA